MKRIGAILVTLALIMMLSVSFCFADSGLTIENTYPEDGSTGASVENLGVKIHFSEDMTEKVVGKSNNGCFQLYDDEGRKLPTRVLYNEKEEGEVLVLLENKNNTVQVKGNTEYTLKISKNTVDDKGNALGEDKVIKFKTLNQSVNTMISMGMMVVMFGGIMVVSARAAKKEAETQKKEATKVNPYKESKRTGKSVEEIVEKDQKKKAKEAQKAAKKAAKEASEDDYYEEEVNKYRVSSRRSAYKAGSKYAAARKAEAEAKKAQNAKKTASSKKRKK
ncbi:MAG: Ig-like domain-containing protein [Firmicutes bacterium]|nr:Ig-like domain-containing protein [Bacillota bacterium]